MLFLLVLLSSSVVVVVVWFWVLCCLVLLCVCAVCSLQSCSTSLRLPACRFLKAVCQPSLVLWIYLWYWPALSPFTLIVRSTVLCCSLPFFCLVWPPTGTVLQTVYLWRHSSLPAGWRCLKIVHPWTFIWFTHNAFGSRPADLDSIWLSSFRRIQSDLYKKNNCPGSSKLYNNSEWGSRFWSKIKCVRPL